MSKWKQNIRTWIILCVSFKIESSRIRMTLIPINQIQDLSFSFVRLNSPFSVESVVDWLTSGAEGNHLTFNPRFILSFVFGVQFEHIVILLSLLSFTLFCIDILIYTNIYKHQKVLFTSMKLVPSDPQKPNPSINPPSYLSVLGWPCLTEG